MPFIFLKRPSFAAYQTSLTISANHVNENEVLVCMIEYYHIALHLCTTTSSSSLTQTPSQAFL